MPCTTGRATHQLCKGDCPENSCACPTPVGFSSRPYCFCEERSDAQSHNQLITLADARVQLCDYITASMDAFPPQYANVTDFATILCSGVSGNGPAPVFNCPLEIILEGSGVSGPTGAVGPFSVTVLDKGVCADGDSAVLEAAYYDVKIDTFECGSFQNVSP